MGGFLRLGKDGREGGHRMTEGVGNRMTKRVGDRMTEGPEIE